MGENMSCIYEILDDKNNVINTIIADQNFCDEHYAGRYREIKITPAATYIITKVALRFRFTDAEYVAMLNAAKIDAEVQMWYDTFNMMTSFDLRDQRTIDGINNFVSKGLLTQARADAILTAPAESNEIPS